MQQVLLADSHPLFRLGLRGILKRTHPGFTVLEAETFGTACDLLRSNPDIALVTLDVGWPDSDDDCSLARLCNEFPHVPIVVLALDADPDAADRALASGAAGFIPVSTPCAEIARLLQEIVAPGIPTDRLKSLASLSPAQWRILRGLQQGLRNKQIAFEMGVTENTVKTYLSTMYRRLGVSTRTQMLALLGDMADSASLQ